jgi:glycine/D-amino acid oxidase-like deaminating enzyme
MAERPSLSLAGNVLGSGDLDAEGKARRATGIDATYLSLRRLQKQFGIDRQGALLSQGNLALDPCKLGAGLLVTAASKGARLYAPVEATEFKANGSSITVETAGGPLIEAGAVVLAAGYELSSIVPASNYCIRSTWAIATRPLLQHLRPMAALIWEASDPYLYARATTDGRVVCGGEDEDFVDERARDRLIEQKSNSIASKLGRLFPTLDPKPQFAWSGSFGTTPTGLPIIGRVPRRGPIYAIMGFGGNGITFSRLASEIVRSALNGEDDRDADLFAFGN